MIGVGWLRAGQHLCCAPMPSEVARVTEVALTTGCFQTTIKLKTFLEVAEAVRDKSDAEPQVVNTILLGDS